MTLGNDPQPLTRRQAREMARGQEPAVAPGEAPSAPGTVTPDAVTPDAAKPAPSSGKPAPFVAKPSPKATVAAPTPAAATTHPEAPVDDDTVVEERTLSRRELRAMLAAQGGVAPEDDGVDDPVTPAAPNGAVSDASAATLNPPMGHWSVDREADDHVQVVGESQSFGQIISRGVGAGGIPTTTNALILPSIPQQGTVSGPLTSTGEILITGSIDLPRSLGATGQHPDHFDSAEMDHMLDQLDEGVPTSSVAPVSASKAVSTHTSTRGVMTPPRKINASVPMILAITAAVLAAGVIALVAAGYLFRIF